MRKGKSAAGDAKSSSMRWGTLIVLSIACFILVFDTTAMSVAINDLVIDLETDVSTIQAVMAIYTLVMASMMLCGAKLGDMYGRKKVFLIGTVIYGVGTATASLSPNVAVLLTGWSIIEGCAAAAGAAVGPMLGGFIISELSWRWVFAGELILVVFILIRSGMLKEVEIEVSNYGPSEENGRIKRHCLILRSLKARRFPLAMLLRFQWGQQ
jgi:MFS family permease